jgi:hypothetical protein
MRKGEGTKKKERNVPSLVGEGMIIQPLIGKHAAEDDEAEGGDTLR